MFTLPSCHSLILFTIYIYTLYILIYSIHHINYDYQLKPSPSAWPSGCKCRVGTLRRARMPWNRQQRLVEHHVIKRISPNKNSTLRNKIPSLVRTSTSKHFLFSKYGSSTSGSLSKSFEMISKARCSTTRSWGRPWPRLPTSLAGTQAGAAQGTLRASECSLFRWAQGGKNGQKWVRWLRFPNPNAVCLEDAKKVTTF